MVACEGGKGVVDGDDLSGCKSAFVGGEEERRSDDLLHSTKAGHRRSGDEFFAASGIEQLAIEVGGEDAGGDGVDADTGWRPFDCERTGESADGCFACAVGGDLMKGDEGREAV